MENTAMVDMIFLSAEKKVSLDEIMNHQIIDEYLSIFNTNRSMAKFQKFQLVQMLNWKKTPGWQLQTYISLVDMAFL